MGFGFVEFDQASSADSAIATLQGTVLDGHALELKASTKRLTQSTAKEAPKPGSNSSKLICRNVAFQATAKELRDLFSSYGHLKRVRMPKKFDGSHRGFAFIDFATAQEATNAFKALSSTHLYGRHLVLEWAEENDAQLSTLRDKAVKDVSSGAAPPQNKRIKFGEDGDEMDFA